MKRSVLSTLLGVVLQAAPQVGFPQALEEMRSDFIEGCVAEGNEMPICACIFDEWTKDMPVENHAAAQSALTMFLGQAPTNNEDMMAAAQMLQTMQGVVMQCALGETQGRLNDWADDAQSIALFMKTKGYANETL